MRLIDADAPSKELAKGYAGSCAGKATAEILSVADGIIVS
jgi:hypothetical protein